MGDVVFPDKLRLLVGASELASLEAAKNEHGSVIAGLLVCRDAQGRVGVALNGGVEGASGGPDGGNGTIRNGVLLIDDGQGHINVRVVGGNEEGNEDGGIIILSVAGDHVLTPGPEASGAIELNASKRSLVIRSASGETRVELGAGGNLALGGGGTFGEMVLRDKDGKDIGRLGGGHANLTLGGAGLDADLLLRDGSGDTRIHLDAGGGGDPSATARVFVDGVKGDLMLGGNEVNGELLLRDTGGKTRIHADAQGGHIKLTTASGELKVHIDGEHGDIVLPNGDCAEDFELTEAEHCDPGTVMVIDGEGGLRQSEGAYDRKVAGVLSGAGDLRPGLILGRKLPVENRQPLALVGKVLCKVDAQYASIEIGDLLTTSPTRGHAMKACDPPRAFGAVIGKALRPLAAGRGLIPILVALQ